MIEELVSRVFAVRNAAHVAHWKSKTLSEHMALGSFYDEIIDTLDKLVEAYQGYFGLIGEVPSASPTQAAIIPYITVEAAWISKNRSTIAKSVPALENIVDELTGVYLITIYKLKIITS